MPELDNRTKFGHQTMIGPSNRQISSFDIVNIRKKECHKMYYQLQNDNSVIKIKEVLSSSEQNLAPYIFDFKG